MSYRAVTVQCPPWWAIEITEGLPDHMFAHTQARRLDAVERTAREAIADLLDVDPDEVEVEVTIEVPESLAGTLAELEAAEAKAREAARAARELRARAVRTVRDQGFTVREAALLLGVSHQRISQLASQHRA